MCLQYAAATQWLISSSIKIRNPEEAIDGLTSLSKPNQLKSGTLSQALKSTTKNAAVTDSVL